jgi:hypothetical protein
MAQLMKYYNYPEMGTGSYQYIHVTYDLLSANFNIPYQWTLMSNDQPGNKRESGWRNSNTKGFRCFV